MGSDTGMADGAAAAGVPRGAAGIAAITEVFLIDVALVRFEDGKAARQVALPNGAVPLPRQSSPQVAPAEAAALLGVRHRGAAQAVLLAAFCVDLLLYGLVVPFLPGHAQALGASQPLVGALFASYAAGLLAATPPAAWLTDHLGARRTLLAGLVALFAATLLFAFAPGLPALFAARIAQGISGAITWTAGLALVAQIYMSSERLAVFSRVFVASSVGILIGPPLGGALFAWGGFRAPFLVGALLVALDGLGRVLFLPGRRAPGRAPDAREAAGATLWSGRFVLALAATLVGAAVLTLLEPTLPPLLALNFGLQPSIIGLLFGGTILIYTAALPLATAATRRLGAEITIVFGLFFGALALVLLGASGSVGHVVFALAAVGLAAACTLGPTLEMLTAVAETRPSSAPRGTTRGVRSAERLGGAAPRHTGSKGAVPYGAIYGAYNLAYAGGILVGPLAAGFATGALGPAPGIALPAVLPLVMGVVMLGGARQRHRRADGKDS